MIRALRQQLAKNRDREHPAASIETSSGDALTSAPAPRTTAAPIGLMIQAPGAFGIKPPCDKRVDLTHSTLAGDQMWRSGERDNACAYYERLTKRFVREPLPWVKLAVAYDAMNERKALAAAQHVLLNMAGGRCESAMLFLRLFHDREHAPSHEMLNFTLEKAFKLGQVSTLSPHATQRFLREGRCAGETPLAYAARHGLPIDAIGRMAAARNVHDELSKALTVAETCGRQGVVASLLLAGGVPSSDEQLDRFVDLAFKSASNRLLNALVMTRLRPGYRRMTSEGPRTLCQLVVGHAYVSHETVDILRKYGFLDEPIEAGDAAVIVAMRRSLSVLTTLLEARYPVDQANPASGNTPLIEAGLYGLQSCVGVLLEHGADPLARNHAGLTAEQAAHAAGFASVAERIHLFPLQRALVSQLQHRWQSDYFDESKIKGAILAFDRQQIDNLRDFAWPMLGLDSRTAPAAARAGAMGDRGYYEQAAWRRAVRLLVRLAKRASRAQWQALAVLLSGLPQPSMIENCCEMMDGCFFPPLDDVARLPLDTLAPLANFISGAAYQPQNPALRANLVQSAIKLARIFGGSACAALVCLNDISTRGFDGAAFLSVMWDFVRLRCAGGDTGALTRFAADGRGGEGRYVRLTVHQRVARIEAESKRLAELSRAAGAAPAVPDKRPTEPLHVALQAARGVSTNWLEHAGADHQQAIRASEQFFRSTDEMQRLRDGPTDGIAAELILCIFGDELGAQVLGPSGPEAVRAVRREMQLRWHPDKAQRDRRQLAEDMFVLWCHIEKALVDQAMRQVFVASDVARKIAARQAAAQNSRAPQPVRKKET